MKILELLDRNCILANLKAGNKQEVLEELAGALVPGQDGLTLQTVVEVLLDRERLGSTGIGDNIAIPHGKLANLSKLRLAFGRSLKGVDFSSMDGKPTHLFFLLLAPINSAGLHLKALAKISRMLMSQSFRESLMKAASVDEIYQLLAERDAEF
jgi:PTS system nitrogen regulatory IIA component